MISREEAVELVKVRIKRNDWLKHLYAVEAIMRGLAKKFNDDEDLWGLVGLLHDIDYPETESNPALHGLTAERLLKGSVPESVTRAIKAHNFENTSVAPESRLEKALITADAVSGLIITCALVMPSKKLNEVQIKSVKKKFKDKDFARSVKRERISLCEEIQLSKEELFQIALESLKPISEQLEL